MGQYNIAEAKAQLSDLTRRALVGEESVIARNSVPLVRLVPVQSPNRPRQPGSGKG
jgi:prevent-host-death family protein